MGLFVLVFEEQSLSCPCLTLNPSHQPVLMEWKALLPHTSQVPDRPAQDEWGWGWGAESTHKEESIPPSTPLSPPESRRPHLPEQKGGHWAGGEGGRRGRQLPADSRVPRFHLSFRVNSAGRNPS